MWPALAIVWFLVLALGVGPLPALGPMFEVRGGIWQHTNVKLNDQSLSGLKKPVTVTYDAAGVPHFFAESEADLYLAQGFVTASQRLFQLDVSTRQVAGKLTEMFGAKAAPYDEFFVKFGMRAYARETLAKYTADPRGKAALEAYSAGVNAYVDQLDELPPEYKVLNVKPAHFTPENVIYMSKALSWGLSGRAFDTHLTEYAQKIGVEKVLRLFPRFLPAKFEDFVIPPRSQAEISPEKAGDFPFVSALKDIPKFPLPNPGRGSNNWVVSAAKSTTGTSLLANDTHLNITLPSTWFETQLVTPEFNVYGVSLVAIPGIILGFNKDLAWGTTNGTTDALDFFEVEFEDETSLKYKTKAGLKTAEVRQEKIPGKLWGASAVEVVKTVFGFVVHREGKLGLAADWAGGRVNNELRAVREQFTTKTAEDCLKNFDEWYSPIQNFVCADTKNIGLVHAGWIPHRMPGEGRFIMDSRGMDRGLSEETLPPPRLVNPREGFIESANQKVVGPGYPGYFGWDFEPPFRGMMIRRTLSSRAKHSPENLIELQKENLDLHAEMVTPLLLRHLDRTKLSEKQKNVADLLTKWDFRARANEIETSVFKTWWTKFKERLFDDELGRNRDGDPLRLYPKHARVAWMIERLEASPDDGDALWIDDPRTPEKESLEDIATQAFLSAWDDLVGNLGTNPADWQWKKRIKVAFGHIGRIPGFGSKEIDFDGTIEGVRGQSANHGAVYKLVVATGAWPQAWIQVPGGNEGDPFSPDYGRFLGEWALGEMREAEFYRDRDEAVKGAVRVLTLSPEGAK